MAAVDCSWQAQPECNNVHVSYETLGISL